MPGAKNARHESKKQVKFECVDIYVPNEFLVGGACSGKGRFRRGEVSSNFYPFCQNKGALSSKKIPIICSFRVVRFDTLKKGDNFRSIDYFMKFFTLCFSPFFTAFAFSENGPVFGWRGRGTDEGLLERFG